MNKKEIQFEDLSKSYPSLKISGEILDDDLNADSREVAEMFRRAIEKSGRN